MVKIPFGILIFYTRVSRFKPSFTSKFLLTSTLEAVGGSSNSDPVSSALRLYSPGSQVEVEEFPEISPCSLHVGQQVDEPSWPPDPWRRGSNSFTGQGEELQKAHHTPRKLVVGNCLNTDPGPKL